MLKTTLAVIAAATFAGCAPAHTDGQPEQPTTVSFHNLHGKDVEVGVSCGTSRATVLGVVAPGDEASFDIPNETARCVWGLRMLLVPTGHPRGYRTQPIMVRMGHHVEFWIEKYPGDSAWRTT